MTTPAIIVTGGTPARDAARLMHRNRIKQVPVTRPRWCPCRTFSGAGGGTGTGTVRRGRAVCARPPPPHRPA
ncbi:CBS domain-containing protein [Planotetraspora sp. A-T 1434]|uniref:CBS domain-containing protein n=1 Tax=Planotetraspora sp. A-T 1434 TaxID=2979219 RepID=UPI0039659434